MDPDMDMVEDQEEGMEDVDVTQTSEDNPNNDPAFAYSVGGYNISIMEKQLPFLGQLLSAPILLLATILPEYELVHQSYAYAVAIVGLILGTAGLYLVQFAGSLYDQSLVTVPVLGNCTVGYTLSMLCFVWWAVGAGILTFSGPFTITGNGYFATWAGFFASAMGVGLTRQHLQDLNNYIRLATCCIIIICSVPSTLGGFFDGEAIYAITLASLTLAFCIIFVNFREMVASFVFYILLALTLLWVVEAALVTFRGPFDSTGNGYFASWGAAFLCIALASQQQRN